MSAVVERWRDAAGVERTAPPDTVAALREVLGDEPADGVATERPGPPARCHLPPGVRAWGLAVQLAAARSRSSWGIGDLADLRLLAHAARDRGAGFLALSPLHAPAPALPQQPSPYYASSRCFRNPLHLRVEEVDGAELAGEEVSRAAAAGRALDEDRHVDRDRVWELKREALEACFAAAGRPRIRAEPATERWGAWCATAEVHGGDWRAWPADLDVGAQQPGALAALHVWLQGQLDGQVAAVGLPLVQDLAVGFDPGGFDAWRWRDQLALDWRIGAPPDEFNGAGQDWGLPPFVPSALAASGFEPWRETLGAVLRHAGGLRVDHVMGLFRLWWVPPGGSPADGAYVRYPAADLLDLLAAESVRAGAVVVGEDLGTVEPSVRTELAARAVLSTRLLWFEDDRPERWPEQALAMVTTHDLPTVAGVGTGADLDGQRTAGVPVTEEGNAGLRRRLVEATGAPADEDAAAVAEGAHGALARAPSALLAATLEDVAGVVERPNMPGTLDTWPNWSLALPEPLEDLVAGEAFAAVARALGRPDGRPRLR